MSSPIEPRDNQGRPSAAPEPGWSTGATPSGQQWGSPAGAQPPPGGSSSGQPSQQGWTPGAADQTWGQQPPQNWGQQTPQNWGQPPRDAGSQTSGQSTGGPPTHAWGQPTGGQPAARGQQHGNQTGNAWGQQPHGPQSDGPQSQQWGQQAPGQPTQQWGQQAPGQPTRQWGQPGGQWGPQNGQQTWAQPAYGQPPKKSNKAVLITAVAVVVALLAGGAVYWFGIRQTSAEGKDTPREAAAQLFADIDNGDVVALADSFDPVEAKFFNDLAGDVVEHFKRLGLLTDNATVGNSTGTTVSISGITFDDSAAEKPLEDLTVVKLTGGVITITPADTSQNETDLFKRLKDAVAKASKNSGLPGQAAIEPTTIDIAQVIRDDNNGEPLRISTVLRDGSWYPSMFYTLADYWTQANKLGPVTAGDKIDAVGAGSAEEAVEEMITAIGKQDVESVIQLLPPDEMAAVHTYGRKIVDEAGQPSSDSAISDFSAEWVTSEVTGGTLVSVKSVEFTVDGEHGRIDIDKDAGVATVTANGKTQTIDADTIANQLGTGDLGDIHPNMPDFVSRMLKAVMGVGVVTTKVGDSWYVSIPRTFTGVFTTLLGGMEQQDIEMFIDLAGK